MSEALSLLFVGGIADSGKSAVLRKVVEFATDIKPFAISDFLRTALDRAHKNPGVKLGPEVTFIDWKTHEAKAIENLVAQIGECHNDPNIQTIVINTHFSTYSPGGSMPGLDPDSIDRICQACHLTECKQGKAAVVLIDIGLADVLHWRGQHWTTIDAFTTGSSLMEDLQFNRVYALYYYNILRTTLDKDRVLYHRVFVDYSKVARFSGDVEDESEFKLAFNGLADFLKAQGFTKYSRR